MDGTQLSHHDPPALREKIDLARIDVHEILGCHTNLFRLQEAQHEVGIALTDIGDGQTGQHVAAPEHLCFEQGTVGTELEQAVDQDLHGESAVARGLPKRILVRIGIGQHEMIHATDARQLVADTGGDAGPEHRYQNHVALGDEIFTRKDFRSVDVQAAVEV